MADRWRPVKTRVPRGTRLVSFGPFGDRLPARFEYVAESVEHPLQVMVSASFDGTDRVRVDRVCIERTDETSVTPEDMTRVQLAQVVHGVAHSTAMDLAVQFGARVEWGREHDGPLDDDEIRRLARQYWLEYVTWGKPRQHIMSAFELARTTATRAIHKARDRYGLPGPHDEQEA